MTSDDDKAKLGKRLTGHHDPQDPDGLLTLDDVTEHPSPPREVAGDTYPRVPRRHKSTPHDRGNGPV